MNDLIGSVIAIVLLGLLIVAMFFIGQYLAAQTCAQKYASFENKYSYYTYCQIKIKGKWIPADSYRVL